MDLYKTKRRLAQPHRAGSRPRLAFLFAMSVALTGVTGCDLDSLLDVDLPGNVGADDLDNPRLAATLANSAQASFECAFPEHVRWMGYWTLKIQDGASGRPGQLATARASTFDFYADPCGATVPVYAPMHTARVSGANAAELIAGFPDNQVPNKQALLARSLLYEGYAALLVTEPYCAVVLDGGPVQSRAVGFTYAEEKFTQALEHAALAGGPVGSDVRNAALIGRARARLNLGNGAGVVSDASQVDEGFVFYSTHDLVPARRNNRHYELWIIGNQMSVGEKYRPMRFLEGVPDPRLPIVQTDRLSSGGNLLIWEARLWNSHADDMVVGSWREAMMMIAEVEGGQTAVNIINELRAKVADAPYVNTGDYSLPVFSSSDPAEIHSQVREERQRETFMMGTEVGDLIRWGGPWPTGVDERGRAIDAEGTCLLLPEFEVFGNPNIDTSPRTPS